jgi:hypothetical protein
MLPDGDRRSRQVPPQQPVATIYEVTGNTARPAAPVRQRPHPAFMHFVPVTTA